LGAHHAKDIDAGRHSPVAVGFEFSGHFESNWSMKGTIDRITGSIGVSEMMLNASGVMILGESWDLTCAPTKRIF
jgi:hypothetical protein